MRLVRAALLLSAAVEAAKTPLTSGQAELHRASAAGDTDLVLRLLDRGDDINVKSGSGRTPLMIACDSGRVEAVKLLVERGADLRVHGLRGGATALTLAASRPDEKLATDLVTALVGGDRAKEELGLNLTDANQMPALWHAVRQGHGATVDVLLAAGADINQAVNEQGQSSLGALVAQPKGMSAVEERMYARLLASGANIDQADKNNVTVLMLAASGKADADETTKGKAPAGQSMSQLDIVKGLLRHERTNSQVPGYTHLLQDGKGTTALMHAVQQLPPDKETPIIEALIEFGNEQEHGNNGLMVRDDEGRTALALAIYFRPNLVRSSGK